MNIVDFINEMGDNNLLCDPCARYTPKQQKITNQRYIPGIENNPGKIFACYRRHEPF